MDRGRLGRRQLFGVIALGTALALSRPGGAQQSPEEVVDTLVDQIIDLLESGALRGEGGIERLATTIDQDTDLDRLGRLVLGRHWRSADQAQQAEYLELFRQLMLRKFVGHLGAYSGAGLPSRDELFTIEGSRSIGNRDVIVDSRLDPPDRPPVDVKWRLREDDGGFVIIDLVVENVSLLISQRSEFSSVIGSGGIDGLLAEMRQRLERSPS